MPNNNHGPKELLKSEREELIELRERNEYFEAKLLYQKSWIPCFGKSVYKQRKDASSTRYRSKAN